MTRRMLWIPVTAVLMLAAIARPWEGGEAEARPAKKALCRAGDLQALEDALVTTRRELEVTRAELAVARAQQERAEGRTEQLLRAEERRRRALEAQLGSPMVETLKGSSLR